MGWEGEESEDGTKLKQIYPVHDAVMCFRPGDRNDAENFANLLDKMGEKVLDQPNTEWHDCTPLSFSAFSQYSYECTLILLKRGADPYKMDTKGYYPVLSGLKDTMGWSATGKPGALGFSDGFWDRFDAI